MYVSNVYVTQTTVYFFPLYYQTRQKIVLRTGNEKMAARICPKHTTFTPKLR
jgi:hypothetical protein